MIEHPYNMDDLDDGNNSDLDMEQLDALEVSTQVKGNQQATKWGMKK